MKKFLSIFVCCAVAFTSLVLFPDVIKAYDGEYDPKITTEYKLNDERKATITTTKSATDNNDGTYTIQMETWGEVPSNNEAYDIVLLFDQSTRGDAERTTLIDYSKELIRNLPIPTIGEHKISIAGYGRINNPEREGSGLDHYNTGYYYKSGSGWKVKYNFECNGFSWDECDLDTSSLPTISEIPSNFNYNNVFMSVDAADNVLRTSVIRPFDAGASRLDAGLVMADKILDLAKNNGRPKMILTIANTIAYRQGDGTYTNRCQAIENAANIVKNDPDAMMLSMGKYTNAGIGQTWDTEENFETMMDYLADEDYMYLPIGEGYDLKTWFTYILNTMYRRINKINIKDVISEYFELVPNENIAVDYAYFAGNDSEGNPTWGNTLRAGWARVTTNGSTVGVSNLEINGINDIEWRKVDGTTETVHNGYKHIITFKIKLKDDSMTGNDIPTNINGKPSGQTGVYRNETQWVAPFAQPTVNIPIVTGSITINKKATAGPTIDNNQTFIFSVVKNDSINFKPITVAIQGEGSKKITGLPLGEYTTTENKDWSWRYTPKDIEQSVTLTKETSKAEVEFENSRDNNKWLSGETYVINTFE